MPRFAANLSMMFTELPVQERFSAAARAGFKAVEILFPYDHATKQLSRAAMSAGLEFALMNTPPPNWAGGPRGFAAIPGLEERFRTDFERALRFAKSLRVQNINIMPGNATGPEAEKTFLRNLAWGAERAAEDASGIALTIEPVNPAGNPENFLTDYDRAAAAIDLIGAPNLGLQLDAFHAQAINGNVIGTFEAHRDIVRHIQIASYPARQEPNDDSFDLGEFLRLLDREGYAGFVGAEYEPRALTRDGLHWLERAVADHDGTRV